MGTKNFSKKTQETFEPFIVSIVLQPFFTDKHTFAMELKEQIISRSKDLFMKFGVRSVTMDDIARELGISKKTLYQYFENKDQLVNEVIQAHCEESHCAMVKIHEQADNALDEITKMGMYIIAKVEHVSASTLYDLRKYYRMAWENLMTHQDTMVIECMRINLQRGIQEGLFRSDLNVEIIARIYAKAVYAIVEEISNPNTPIPRREFIRALHDYHVHAIATPKGLKLWKHYLESSYPSLPTAVKP